MMDTDLLVQPNDEFKKSPFCPVYLGLLVPGHSFKWLQGAQMLLVKLPSLSLINLNHNYLVDLDDGNSLFKNVPQIPR